MSERLSREELNRLASIDGGEEYPSLLHSSDTRALCDTALALYDENDVLRRQHGKVIAAVEEAEAERDAALTRVATLHEALGRLLGAWEEVTFRPIPWAVVRDLPAIRARAALAATPGTEAPSE